MGIDRRRRGTSSRIATRFNVLIQSNYLAKWTVVGLLIGVIAGLRAILFYAAIQLVTDLFLGGLTGFFPPNPAGKRPPWRAFILNSSSCPLLPLPAVW